ncbi:hypothetical protein [Helicobacter suis]|uniref:HP0838 family lipoprotein n=1 Tax=Helicobacter suis TaxID=104628 RepID=UPI0013D5D084|nr:hypothetical protein [Helicobacter suis]
MLRKLLALILFGVLMSACHHQVKPKKPHKVHKPKPNKPHKPKKPKKPKKSHKKVFIKKSAAERKAEQQAQIKKELAKFKLIYIYTPVFRFYDYGTIGHNKEGDLELVLYKLSKYFGNIVIKKNYICFSGTCSAKWVAARDMFGEVSYGDLFDDIVLGRDIFQGIGKQIQPNGVLLQRFIENGQMIYYERSPEKILFQNMTTGVAIVIQPYHPQ